MATSGEKHLGIKYFFLSVFIRQSEEEKDDDGLDGGRVRGEKI